MLSIFKVREAYTVNRENPVHCYDMFIMLGTYRRDAASITYC